MPHFNVRRGVTVTPLKRRTAPKGRPTHEEACGLQGGEDYFTTARITAAMGTPQQKRRRSAWPNPAIGLPESCASTTSAPH
jgi:hypothetical protein